MNPCGRITDLISCAFDSDCKFYRDDGRVQTVRFFEAADDAPVLGMWNVIDSGTNEPKRWPEWTLGGKPQPPVTFTGQKAPAGLLYDHVCGTADDFANGATFDPLRPPLQIGGQGLPLCCAPPELMRGAAGVGGKGVYNVIPPAPPPNLFLDFYQNFQGTTGILIRTSGTATSLLVYLFGTSLPPTPAGWTLLRTATTFGGTYVCGLYFKPPPVFTFTFQTVGTGTQTWSAMAGNTSCTHFFAAGAQEQSNSASATVPTVATTAQPCVPLVWLFMEGQHPFTPPHPDFFQGGFYGTFPFPLNSFFYTAAAFVPGSPLSYGTFTFPFSVVHSTWCDVFNGPP